MKGRPVYPGEAVRKFKTWEGHPPYRALVIAQGKFERLAGGEGMLRTKSSEMRVVFFENVLPPGIKSGDTVCVCGRLWTANLGRYYSVQDAILISGRGARQALGKWMKKYSMAPKTYTAFPEAFVGKLPKDMRVVDTEEPED